MLIGSADLMERNLDRRVEVLCHIRDTGLKSHLHDVVLEKFLADTETAMELQSDGSYKPVFARGKLYNAQETLLTEHSKRRPTL